MKKPDEVSDIILESARTLLNKRAIVKSLSRFQMSAVSICRITNTPFLPDEFIDQLKASMHFKGWIMFRISNSSFGFLNTYKTSSWIKVSYKEKEKN